MELQVAIHKLRPLETASTTCRAGHAPDRSPSGRTKEEFVHRTEIEGNVKTAAVLPVALAGPASSPSRADR